MSEILDALKKLEREKALRSNTAPNIAVEILTPDLPRHGKKPFFFIASISLSALAAAGITYGLMGEWRVSSKPAPPAVVKATPPARPSEPVTAKPGPSPLMSAPSPPVKRPPAVTAGTVKSNSKPHSIVTPPAASPSRVLTLPKALPSMQKPPSEPDQALSVLPQPTAAVRSTPIVPAVPSLPVPLPDERPEEIARAVPTVRERSLNAIRMQDVPPPPPPNASAAGPLSLKVTVIVWDEDPSRRWAMINGMKLSEGSMIEGVKVEEITLTNVRFLQNGRHFEISMY